MPEGPKKPVDNAAKAYAAAVADLKPGQPAAVKPQASASPRKMAATSKRKTAAKVANPASDPMPATVSKPAAPATEALAAPMVPPPATTKPAAATFPVADPDQDASPAPTVSQLKEKIMATAAKTATASDFTQPMAAALGEFQTRAKAAYEKGTEAVGEMTEFTKGNVEALVESGKILAGGAQDLGKVYAEEAKSAYETFTADLKEVAAVKSPTELFQLQGKIFRRNFDAMVATSSKNTEAMIKLANEAFSPLSGRINLATEKLSKVA